MQFITDRRSILDLLESHWEKSLQREPWRISDDGVVSVDANVSVRWRIKEGRLPFRWGRVGSMDLDHAGLITLEGCPHTCDGSFTCNSNDLTNLLGGPSAVRLRYRCTMNPLASLEGLPDYIIPESDQSNLLVTYDPSLPLLRSLMVKGLGKIMLYPGGAGPTAQAIGANRIIQRYIGKGANGVMPCAAELIKAGYRGNARL